MPTTTTKPSPYGAVKFTGIDEYHAAFPKQVQQTLQQLRQAIAQAAPKATETISYNMPAFKQDKNLVYYAAHKAHIGFYPTASPIKVFKEELAKFNTTKGAIRFTIGEPLPIALIKKIVKLRVKEVEEKKAVKTKNIS